jgi:hypothetical protein
MLKSLGQLYRERLAKGGEGSGCRGENCGRPKGSGKSSYEYGDKIKVKGYPEAKWIGSKSDTGSVRISVKTKYGWSGMWVDPKDIQGKVSKLFKGAPIGNRNAAKDYSPEQNPKETPLKRMPKVSDERRDKYYVRLSRGDFGGDAMVKMLNAKIGRAEGRARAYRVRAGKMSDTDADEKGRSKEALLRLAHSLGRGAERMASMRDSALGRPAKKMLKQESELTDQEIIAMIDAGEFNDLIDKELDEMEQSG